MELDKIGEINQKIAEIKKRILLAEGQKTANTAEWQKQNRINCETISTLKKEIKELTSKCGQLKNPLQRPLVIKEPNVEPRKASATATPTVQVGKACYPIGARNAEDAIFLTDLKLTENRKQLDLLRHRLKCKQQRYTKLKEQYQELKACMEHRQQAMSERPPETLEEDANRKLVCQLENEIHRTNVQWMEAEHIRKKYRSIEASLMNDSEKFERSLKELEESLNQQQTEINRLQEVHNEAVEMRDAAKIILQRQEQQAHHSQKVRERQALEFRKQVEMRKMELERIGRKLFLEGKPTTLAHQDSIGSESGEQHTAKTNVDEEDPNAQLASVTTDMDNLFKLLMEVTGATSPSEVLVRFTSQKESAMRLSYLRNAAETEKNQLEAQREKLTKELEASKFSDVKESEVNQEVIEDIKTKIKDFSAEQQKCLEVTEKSSVVLKYIKERLSEMIFKLQEIDESNIVLKERDINIKVENLPTFLASEAQDEDIIEILKLKLEHGQSLSKQQVKEASEELNLEDEELFADLEKPKSPAVPESEKPPPMPICYYNLLAGRTQRATGTLSSSPEQAPAPAAPTEEESEVPSRNYLKRQSLLIVDSKSRRKPFRPAPAARRK